MRYIELTQGKHAIIDDEDFDLVNVYTWCALKKGGNWYVSSHKHNKILYIHRLIMNPKKNEQVDHKNGDGLDNRKQNLRICNNQQNAFNAKGRQKTSKYKGVSWFKQTKRWRTVIMLNKKQIHIGYFEDEIEASKAYNKKAKELFGEFARINDYE